MATGIIEAARAELETEVSAAGEALKTFPRSATADRIDMICADALGEPRTP